MYNVDNSIHLAGVRGPGGAGLAPHHGLAARPLVQQQRQLRRGRLYTNWMLELLRSRSHPDGLPLEHDGEVGDGDGVEAAHGHLEDFVQ